ncbi:MAG TPA: ParB/RepB/Spo0J family partition protein [Anaerolineales bacterium]|nr:ParB/RepB/Spo0J family partition protein [Anaerolineales bacterium]
MTSNKPKASGRGLGRALGRGLDALIPTSTAGTLPPSAGDTPAGILQLAIDSIRPNPRQPRLEMNAQELAELVESIRQHGLIQPLIVARTSQADVYVLVAGQRRQKAARLAGLSTVPVVVREQATDQQLLELALVENVQRSDLAPLEEAAAYQSLAEDFGLSHEQVAERVGKSRVAVTNTLRLLRLAPAVQTALTHQEISEGHARALLGLPTHPAQIVALETVLDKGLNVRQTEELVRKLLGERPQSAEPRPRLPELTELEGRIRDSLGTKVRLQRNQKGQGSLAIHFFSDEELEALLAKLSVPME